MRFVTGRYRNKNVAFIQHSDSDAAVDGGPIANFSDFKFHTDLPYYVYLGGFTATVSLPAKNAVFATSTSKKNGSNTSPVPTVFEDSFTFGLGIPLLGSDLIFGYDNGTSSALITAIPHTMAGNSHRRLDLYASGSNLIFRSYGITVESNIPAAQVTVTVSAFRSFTGSLQAGQTICHMGSDYVLFGGGKFDSRLPFLYKTDVNPRMQLVNRRTYDVGLAKGFGPSNNNPGDLYSYAVVGAYANLNGSVQEFLTLPPGADSVARTYSVPSPTFHNLSY